jgi:hypothetical protein
VANKRNQGNTNQRERSTEVANKIVTVPSDASLTPNQNFGVSLYIVLIVRGATCRFIISVFVAVNKHCKALLTLFTVLYY